MVSASAANADTSTNTDITSTIAGKARGAALNSNEAQSRGTPKAVVERTGLDWLESVTWTPELRVDYPGGAAIGAYTGTITISVA
ncbi:hypothetical protein M2284_004484 [Rhodococcus sp. LBL1]|nr:hypothetical protein [Rhodococcus sp. LBL1]MDH6685687.1 hypothetical protein [Rhodococcus sp. LBL2]